MATLMQKLNRDYDPTDANKAMAIAAGSLQLMRVCQRVLHANNAGMRVGRDDSLELAAKMRALAVSLGFIEYGMPAESVATFHAALEIEAGLR